MEKIFMIIIFCIGLDCQGVWQESTYNSMANCEAASPMVKEYFTSTFPESRGEIHCLTEGAFIEWKQWLEAGNKPMLNMDMNQMGQQ